jgi:hypothetical protein
MKEATIIHEYFTVVYSFLIHQVEPQTFKLTAYPVVLDCRVGQFLTRSRGHNIYMSVPMSASRTRRGYKRDQTGY